MSQGECGLEVITGCMFCGKTEEFIRRLERVRIAKVLAFVFKPETDTRYSSNEVVTHHSRSLPCHQLLADISWQGLLEVVKPRGIESSHVFAFNEAHFFGPRFPALCERLVAHWKAGDSGRA